MLVLGLVLYQYQFAECVGGSRHGALTERTNTACEAPSLHLFQSVRVMPDSLPSGSPCVSKGRWIHVVALSPRHYFRLNKRTGTYAMRKKRVRASDGIQALVDRIPGPQDECPWQSDADRAFGHHFACPDKTDRMVDTRTKCTATDLDPTDGPRQQHAAHCRARRRRTQKSSPGRASSDQALARTVLLSAAGRVGRRAATRRRTRRASHGAGSV